MPVQLIFAVMGTVTYTEAREKLASLWNQVVSTREAVVIKRRGHPDIAMLPADELSSLIETAHLVRSPANARRLLGALKRARSGKGRPMTMDDLRRMSGIDETRR
jgi:antitoxin YefM